MSKATQAFRLVLLLSIPSMLVFAIIGVFVPDALGMMIGLERVEFSYVWIGNVAMLMACFTVMCVPVIVDPRRHYLLAWTLTLGRLGLAGFWLWASRTVAPLSQFGWIDLIFGGIQLLLLIVSPELRPSNFRAELREMLASRRELTRPLRIFSYVVMAGMIMNFFWAAQALFAQDRLASSVGAAALFQSTEWLQAAGMILIVVTLQYLPSALAPVHQVFPSWLLVVTRVLAVMYWLSVAREPFHRPFYAYLIADLTFGILQFVLLTIGLPRELKASPANVAAMFRRAFGSVSDAMTPALRAIAVAVLLLAGAVGYIFWSQMARAWPDEEFASDAEHYKYAAIGLNMSSRIPYSVWVALPAVVPDLFPDPDRGWASFGLLMEEGRELPVGFSLRRFGYKSVEPNCAFCHTGSIRATADGKPVVVPGAPSHELDLEGFQRFLYAAAKDPRFTAENILSAYQKKEKLTFFDRFFQKNVILPAAREGLLKQADAYQWQLRRPQQGRGRTDTFNPTKFAVLKIQDDRTIGTTDLPQTWNQRKRERMWLHWDGNNNSIHERNYAAAMAIGATPHSTRNDSFQRVTNFLLDLKPPAFPGPIDQTLAAGGKQVFDAHCAHCHAFGSAGVGQVTPVEVVGTDRHRLDSFSQALVDDFHLIQEYPFKFDAYRKTNGYANVPLDGIWARGPYLHHGAVPTLWDLLQPPTSRPAVFHRGYNVLDPRQVGFVSSGAEAERVGFRYDTSVPGNGNGGHLYGTTLPEEEKWSLIEYLKTL